MEDNRTQPKSQPAIPQHVPHDTLLDLWFANYPKYLHEYHVECLNEELLKAHRSKTDLTEYLLFLGQKLAMCLQPMASLDDYFRSESTAGELFPPPNLGKHGMSLARHRWMQESLKFVLEKDRKNDDKWHAIRPFMHDWNKNQADNYHAGWVLCIDESISRWLGMHDLDKKANEKAAAAAAAVGDAAVAAAAAAATAAANVTDKQGAIPHPC